MVVLVVGLCSCAEEFLVVGVVVILVVVVSAVGVF
jgi:hypothetical protein